MPRPKKTKEQREAEKHERDLQELVVRLDKETEQAGFVYLTASESEQKDSLLAQFCDLKQRRDRAKQQLRAIADATVIESSLPDFHRMTYSDLLTRTDDELKEFFERVPLNIKGFMEMLPNDMREGFVDYSHWAKKIKELERIVECSDGDS